MIRKCTNDDIESVLEIWLAASVKAHNFVEASFWEAQVENMRCTYLPASEVYVYQKGAQVVGFYALHGKTLAAIFVAPELQGRGIGGVLIEHAKSRQNKLMLTVYKRNTASCKFYLQHGFKVVGEQTDSLTGERELLMSVPG